MIPNRHGSVDDYRYGFQGQEKDDEIKGEGNSLNYTFRMHDPRVGRFFAVDPLFREYPFYSPYSFSGNRVLDAIELEGLEPAQARNTRPFRNRPSIRRMEDLMRGRTSPHINRIYMRTLGFNLDFKILNTNAFRNAQRNHNEFVRKFNLDPRTFNSETGEPNPIGLTPRSLELVSSLSNFYKDLKDNYNLSVKHVDYSTRIEDTNSYVKVSSEYMFDGVCQLKLSLAESMYQELFNNMVSDKVKQDKSEYISGITGKINAAKFAVKLELGPSPVELVNRIFEEAIQKGQAKVIETKVEEQPMINQN
ncbi:MAG: hypothetical protein DCF13_13750 [Flavobacteriaceae bacterium]|nr:MAG: hypothetical protein DCF13_13750 [Flavobacteriaceae bacterium]